MSQLVQCGAGRMGFRHQFELDIPIVWRPTTVLIDVVDMRNDRCLYCKMVRAVMWDSYGDYVMRYNYAEAEVKYEIGDRPDAMQLQTWLREAAARETQRRVEQRREKAKGSQRPKAKAA